MPEKRERTPDDVRAVDDEIRRHTADLVAAYNSANLDYALSYFAPDVIYMPPDRPAMHGLEELRKHFSYVFAADIKLVMLTRTAFASSGEVAMQRGDYHRRIPQGTHHTSEQRGSYEATWRLQSDGEYRVTSLIFGRGTMVSNGRQR